MPLKAKTITQSIESAPLFINDASVAEKIDDLNDQSLDISNPHRIQALNEIMRLKDAHFDQAAAEVHGLEAIEALKPIEPSKLEVAKRVGHDVMTTLNTDVVVLAKKIVRKPGLTL